MKPNFKIPTNLGFRVGRVHGYECVAVRCPKKNGGVIVAIGCRWLTLSEARMHWGERQFYRSVGGDSVEKVIRKRAEKMLALLPEIEKKAKRRGWI